MTPHKLWRDVGMHGVLHERCMERRGASVKIYIHYAWFIWAIQTGIWNLKHKWHCRKYTSNIYFIESMSLQFGDWKVIISMRSQNTNCTRRFLQNNGYDETLHFFSLHFNVSRHNAGLKNVFDRQKHSWSCSAFLLKMLSFVAGRWCPDYPSKIYLLSLKTRLQIVPQSP